MNNLNNSLPIATSFLQQPLLTCYYHSYSHISAKIIGPLLSWSAQPTYDKLFPISYHEVIFKHFSYNTSGPFAMSLNTHLATLTKLGHITSTSIPKILTNYILWYSLQKIVSLYQEYLLVKYNFIII